MQRARKSRSNPIRASAKPTSQPTASNAIETNQEYLARAVAEVKALLRGPADLSDNGILGADFADPAAASPRGMPSSPTAEHDQPDGAGTALELLCRAFRLSPFERRILLLCAGIELDSSFAPLCAAAQGNPAHSYPTFSLALAAFPDAHWSAIVPSAPLRHWRLIEVGTAPVLTAAPLRIDERVMHYLLEAQHMDERLAGIIEQLAPPSHRLGRSHAALAEQVALALAEIQRGDEVQELRVVQLCGADPAERRSIIAAAASILQLRAAAMPADLAPAGAAELDSFVRLWEREVVLGGFGLLVLEFDDDGPDAAAINEETRSRARAAIRLAERLNAIVIISSRERRRLGHRASVVFDLRASHPKEQRAAWATALGDGLGPADEAALDSLTAQFNLGLPAINSIAARARPQAAVAGQAVSAVAWDLCRLHLRARMEGLAQWIETTATWDELVLPQAQLRQLHQIAAHAHQRPIVHDRWGFAAKGTRGLGLSALFAGPSGTGKTMAAEVLANDLRLDLYSIDLSQLVSKYIGETEKNLRRVFDAAEASGAILLFDEADALFGKRTEVKDSHDRYANIEVSYLLQRMEAYRGLAILTTNHRSSLDQAFLRRLRFVVQFPFPDAAHRAEIWRHIFPSATPTQGLNLTLLSKLNVAGGNIRNIALNAAFLAAHAGGPVRMDHLLAAARMEYEKLERTLPESEIAGWK